MKFKIQTYDDQTKFEMYKLQLKAASKVNNWSGKEKSNSKLFAALKCTS